MTLKSIKMARSTLLLLLWALTILGDLAHAAGPMNPKIAPMPRGPYGLDMARPRFPRRDTPYPLAYNIHKAFKPRDVNSLDANQAQKAMVDVRQTIAEVQRLLSQDPSLPRLTKGEIEELFENVTREELNKSLREGDHARAQHMRALMLVLPYHTNNMNPDNLQSIYNMPPVTKLVAGGGEENVGKAPPVPLRPVSVSSTTTGRPVFRQRSTTTEKVSTTTVPITTIRFTTPKPTTFHPALPIKMIPRQEAEPEAVKPPTSTEFQQPDPEPTEPAEVSTEPLTTTEVTSTEAVKQQQEINEILASIGFGDGVPPTFRPLPVELMTTPAPAPEASTTSGGEMNEELKMLLRSFGLLNDEETVGIAPLPQIDVPEELAEIRPAHLVQTDGLKVEEVQEQEVPVMAKPDIRPDDFVAFKPLPSRDDSKVSEELDELLKSFGLLDNSGRNKKSMDQEVATKGVEMDQMPMIDKDLVQIPQMASVLDTLGIPTMNTKKERSGRKYESKKESTGVEMKANGVGSSKSKKKVENEDYRKLEQLWETIRELEKLNTTLTDDSLDALNLRNFNLSESLLAQGPNPLESLDLTRANEIKKKRQQPTTTDTPTRISLDLGTDAKNVSFEIISTTNTEPRVPLIDVESAADPPTSTITSTSTSTSTTTTTEESPSSSESARFSALEDSFGGGADPVAQEPLPQPRRNGFYFLADWNSFLEVGEDPNKVVISFRPQAGDPSRFLPVNVP